MAERRPTEDWHANLPPHLRKFDPEDWDAPTHQQKWKLYRQARKAAGEPRLYRLMAIRAMTQKPNGLKETDQGDGLGVIAPWSVPPLRADQALAGLEYSLGAGRLAMAKVCPPASVPPQAPDSASLAHR